MKNLINKAKEWWYLSTDSQRELAIWGVVIVLSIIAIVIFN